MDEKLEALIRGRLRAWRRFAGLSMEELAQRCRELGAGYISAAVMTNIETDRAKRAARHLTVAELLVIAEALDRPLVDFLHDDGATRSRASAVELLIGPRGRA